MENKKIEADRRRTAELKNRIKIENTRHYSYASSSSLSLPYGPQLATSQSSTASHLNYSSSSLGSLDLDRLSAHSSDSLIATGSDQAILAKDRAATARNAPSNGHVHSNDAHVVAGDAPDQNSTPVPGKDATGAPDRNGGGYDQAHGLASDGHNQGTGTQGQNGGGYSQAGGPIQDCGGDGQMRVQASDG